MTLVERPARHASPGVPVAHPFARALPLFLFAGLCLSSLDTTAKYLVRDHSVFLVVWARYAGQMLVVTPFAWHRAGPGFWRTRRLALQLLRSSMLLIATFCLFGALRYLPLAEASAITFLAPIFIVLLSVWTGAKTRRALPPTPSVARVLSRSVLCPPAKAALRVLNVVAGRAGNKLTIQAVRA